MAVMMPGVDMQYRRRQTQYSRQSHEDNSHFHGHGNNGYPSSPHRSWNEPSMDEAAMKARRRLEEKLGYFRPSRLNGVQTNEGRANQTTTTTRDSDDNQYSISRILGRRPWHFQPINSSASSSSNKSKGEQPMICVVCLEDCRTEDQQVMMELPCSHRFHSKCLLPWLASHPNCPSCRSSFQIK